MFIYWVFMAGTASLFPLFEATRYNLGYIDWWKPTKILSDTSETLYSIDKENRSRKRIIKNVLCLLGVATAMLVVCCYIAIDTLY